MTTRDNDRLDQDRPLDDNRLVDENHLPDDQRSSASGLDADRGWQDEPTIADDRTADRADLADRSNEPDRSGESDRSAESDRAAESDRIDEAGRTDQAAATTQATGTSGADPLVPTDASVDFKARWSVIQQGFVDDPRAAVTDADKLVGDVLQRLSATFDEQHQNLESQWSNGEPSTEDLRSALQRYRAFFERLLTL
jgi:hypothetical protein